jgi:hypothetical protein
LNYLIDITPRYSVVNKFINVAINVVTNVAKYVAINVANKKTDPGWGPVFETR